jgi:hypothetical protein
LLPEGVGEGVMVRDEVIVDKRVGVRVAVSELETVFVTVIVADSNGVDEHVALRVADIVLDEVGVQVGDLEFV